MPVFKVGAKLQWQIYALAALGSFTTVSSFNLQLVSLWRNHNRFSAIFYLLFSVLGGLTTFSLFSLELLQLLTAGPLLLAVGYVLLTLIGGAALCAFGMRLAEPARVDV